MGYQNPHHYMNCALELHVGIQDAALDTVPFIQKKMSQLVIETMRPCIKINTVVSTKNAWKLNKGLLDNGQVFIAIVDVFYLRYRKEFNNTHGAHAVIVVGYDENNDTVTIYDWYEPYFFHGDISFSSFFAARSSVNKKDNNPYSGWPIYNKWFEMNHSIAPTSPVNCLFINLYETLSSAKSVTEGKLQRYSGLDALQYIFSMAARNKNNFIFWQHLYHDFFIISRYYNFLLSNYIEIHNLHEDSLPCPDLFNRYHHRLKEILFTILKNSIKLSDKLCDRFIILMQNLTDETVLLYKHIELLCNSSLFANFMC